MCGILGTTSVKTSSEFERALGKLAHRGPDGFGVAEHQGCLLGHRRLSIIDLSSTGNQPMLSKSRDLALVFNGEIYNYRELRVELERAGAEFSSQSDSEVILAGYERQGIGFFKRLRGMWAFAISDARNGKLVLSRDCFGIKPLYYRLDPKGLSFASEISALVEVVGKVVPDPEAYVLYFGLGMMPGPYSGIIGIRQLMPGDVLEYDIRTGESSESSLLENVVEQKDAGGPAPSLEDALADSVKAHFVSDVPVSILLSGGTDSSLIAALAKQAGFVPECFHVAVEGSSDTAYAKAVAEKLGLPLRILPFAESEMTEMLDKVLRHLDIPLSDISLLPTSLVFQAVAKHAKVVLSGEGGDELFGGYLRHGVLSYGEFGKSPTNFFSEVGPSAFALSYRYPILSRLQKRLDVWRKDILGLYVDEAAVMYAPAIRSQLTEYLQRAVSGRIASKIPAHLFFDLMVYLPYMLMVKGDRMSMMHSVEARVPFLDKEVFRAAESLPPRSRMPENGVAKMALKNILAKHLPKDLVFRGKKGFGFPTAFLSSDSLKPRFMNAVRFHERNADAFGWQKLRMPKLDDVLVWTLLLKKYPRFAFGLISSQAVWERYGL